MKATGVVRRIDDLGRIVIPKELRRTMRIKEGDSLEIFIENNDKIVLKKYSPVQNVNDFLKDYIDSLTQSIKKDIIVTDTEKVIACAGNIKNDFVGKKISIRLEDKLYKRSTQTIDYGEGVEITDGVIINKSAVIKPVNVYGDIIGGVIIFGDKGITDVETSLAEFSGTFIKNYLEN